MLIYGKGGIQEDISREALEKGLGEALATLGVRNKILVIPPDITRFHSFAGTITQILYNICGNRITDILPALGTHYPMSSAEIAKMFGPVPEHLFRIHDWKNDIRTLGVVPEEFINEVSGGRIRFSWPAQVNRLVAEGGHDLVISVGQVVPHEVIGMANYNKNIFVGTGGREGINKSHFLGAVYGMERIMGRADNPVRQVLNYASGHFASHIPILYIHTVVQKLPSQELKIRGLFIGDDEECFLRAADLSLQVNIELIERPFKKAVVYLDPDEFRSTWLGNKSIYRTRMAMADNGELIVLAPGVREFGEDPGIDALIRKYGYRTTTEILQLVDQNQDLRDNLGAAAHLIHGSPEKRFRVTYCPGKLSEEEITRVGFNYGNLEKMAAKYNPGKLRDGINMVDGEEIFFISNPAMGLWACKERFK